MPTERTISVPVRIEDGSEILVEARVAAGEQDIAAWSVTQAQELGKQLFGVAGKLFEHLRDAGPARIKAQLGLGFAVKAGKLTAVLVDGQANANVVVTMEWDLRPRSEQGENGG
jgi:hypothetical protein